MVQRVANAIQGPLGVSTVDAMIAAKRAIEAMREPTDAMILAAGRYKVDDNCYETAEQFRKYTGIPNIWDAMIDAALAEPSGKERGGV
jgi:hypothetical protein